MSVHLHATGTGSSWKMRGRKRKRQNRWIREKGVEDELEELRKKRRTISTVCATLEKDAKDAGTKMAELITKSNSMRKKMQGKEKGVGGPRP